MYAAGRRRLLPGNDRDSQAVHAWSATGDKRNWGQALFPARSPREITSGQDFSKVWARLWQSVGKTLAKRGQDDHRGCAAGGGRAAVFQGRVRRISRKVQPALYPSPGWTWPQACLTCALSLPELRHTSGVMPNHSEKTWAKYCADGYPHSSAISAAVRRVSMRSRQARSRRWRIISCCTLRPSSARNALPTVVCE